MKNLFTDKQVHVKSVVTESADNVYTQHFYFTTSEKLFREPTIFKFKRDEKIVYGGLYIADTIFNKTPIWENKQQRWRFGTICGHGGNYIYHTLILDLNEGVDFARNRRLVCQSCRQKGRFRKQ